jgi:biopolymer transport protein ExbD
MSTIIVPGRRPAFAPIGRLRSSPLSGGKKSGFASLNLTAMVDMFTILVIFLIQLFTSDQVSLSDSIKVPKSVMGAQLQDTGQIIMIDAQGTMLLNSQPIPAAEMGTELDVIIPGLASRLKAAREHDEEIQRRIGKPRDPSLPYEGYVIIQADVKTDFRQVRRVLGSANDAGWAKIKFVTIPAKAADAPGAAPAAEG